MSDGDPRPVPRWRASVPRLSRFAVEHLLLLPLGYTSNNAFRVRQQMHANMLLHLIRDLRKDLPAIMPAG